MFLITKYTHSLATMNHGHHYYWVTLTDIIKFEGIIIIYRNKLTIMCTIFEIQEGIIIGKTKSIIGSGLMASYSYELIEFDIVHLCS